MARDTDAALRDQRQMKQGTDRLVFSRVSVVVKRGFRRVGQGYCTHSRERNTYFTDAPEHVLSLTPLSLNDRWLAFCKATGCVYVCTVSSY